ncbi:MAG: hypothetical protein ACKVTZ_18750, partial [Bacteroidia bacterium]
IMDGEEYRRKLKEQIKQEEKAELLKRKAFLNKVNEIKKQQPLVNAFENIVNANNDDTQDWIDKLNQETALNEAKVEMSLESAEEQVKKLENVQSQIELEKLNAQKLVEDMKRSMGLLPPEEEKAETPTVEEKTPETDVLTPPPTNKKTLGDF